MPLRPLAVLLAILTAAAVTPAASAQCGEWILTDGLAGVSSVAHAAVEWDPDGDGPLPPLTVIAGQFTHAGAVATGPIATWNGQSWSPIGPRLSGTIRALAIHNGQLVIGGDFSRQGSPNFRGAARWDGAQWQTLGDGPGPVRALAVYNDQLIAATHHPDVSSNTIRRWTGAAWETIGVVSGDWGAFAGTMTPYSSGLIVGGNFHSISGVPAARLARWDGQAWSQFEGGASGPVYALLARQQELIVSGGFTSIGGVPASNLARWNGSAWTPLAVNIVGSALALVEHDGDVFAGGTLHTIDGVRVYNVARLTDDGWVPVGVIGNAINGMATTTHGVVACGSFRSAGGTTTDYVALWNGADWSRMGRGFNHRIQSLLSFQGNLYAGGEFSAAGSGVARGVARWHGGDWHPVGSGLPAVGTGVHRLVDYDGTLIACGRFSVPDHGTRSVAWFDGSHWQPLGGGFNDTVSAAAVWQGQLIVGGSFTTAGGQLARHVARWDGAQWHPMGSGFDNSVSALHVHGGQLFAGGVFASSGGVATPAIAVWDGKAWNAVGPGLNYLSGLGNASRLATYGDRLIAAGRFTRAGGGGPALNHIAAWDGAAWHPLGTGLGPQGAVGVYGMIVGHDRLYVAGEFSSAGDQQAFNIAHWDGTAWAPLTGGGARGPVFAIELFQGHLHVGGYSTAAGPTNGPLYWGWWSPVPHIVHHPESLSIGQGQSASFAVESAGPVPGEYAWSRDGQSLTDGVTPTGSVVSGSATSTLMIHSAHPGDSGVYRVELTNACGSVTSVPAILEVVGAPCPADWNNDDTVNSADITAFLTTWITSLQDGTLAADFNNDQLVNSADITAFLSAWLHAVQHGC